LLEANALALYGAGRVSTLYEWLKQFPEPELARHPQLLLWGGRILNNDLGKPSAAMTSLQQAETQFLKQGDLSGAAEACVLQSVVLRMMGRAADSVTMASKALDQLEPIKAGDRVAADAIRNRGLAHGTAGHTLEALSNLRRALQLYEELGNKYRIGMCHQEIGACLCQQGNIPGAEHHFKQAILIWQELGNSSDLANTLNSLGVYLYSVGRYEEALRQFQDALDVAHQIKATRRVAFVQASIGDVYLACLDYERAAKAYALSTEAAREAGVQRLEIYNLVKTGEGLLGLHDLGQALSLASRARQLAAEIGLTHEEGLASALQARIHARQADYAASVELFEDALACLTGNDVLEQAKVRLWWGHSLLLDARSSAACEQLQEAIRLALTMGELMAGLGPTIAETRSLLLHALHRPQTPVGTRDSIHLLLEQCPDEASLTTPSLHVFTFGSPMLVVAGERKQFSQRGRVRRMPEFLAYLLLKGEEGGCRWGEVSAAIWPDLGSDKASISFHQTLKRLRDGIFGTHGYIIVQDDYYQVNPQVLEWCDALAFERLFERAARATPQEALPLQLELIALYQGEFLAGFEVGSWGAAYRALCEDRFLQVVNLAAEQLLNRDAPQEALGVISKGLAQDYYREDLHHGALRAYAQLGLYDQLVLHYTQLRDTFERELGAPPDPALTQLYQQLVGRRHKARVLGDNPARSSSLFAERCKS
jgi:tetratricopeptide (TPR) repeat protein/DNA-binding SARP family transcriptional activator